MMFISGVLDSCKKFVEIDTPRGELIASTVFSNEETATAAVRGIYSEIVKQINFIGNGGMTLFPGLSADEIVSTSANSTYDPFSTNSLLANNIRVASNFWQKGYFHIYHCNVILENLEASTLLKEDVVTRLSGEVKFLRAFFNFYLANLFGDVPLVTSSDFRLNARISRSAENDVYGQIISDLKDAQNLLPEEYPSVGKVRANKWAATALLARVYLYIKEWTNAEEESTKIINAGSYQIGNINGAFGANGTETILEFSGPASSSINTAEGFTFIPANSTTKPPFSITNSLLNSFETGDLRKTNWLKSNTVSSVVYFYPYKYKVKDGTAGATKAENEIVFRLAEQYLIRAESRVQLNNLTGAQADLNIIRVRAGLPNTNANTEPELTALTEKERRNELFAEWGHRWLDLKRTGRADIILSLLKSPNWQLTDMLYPIPQVEIQTNPMLTQNPGY